MYQLIIFQPISADKHNLAQLKGNWYKATGFGILLCLLMLSSYRTWAQILDDTTVQKYGAQTTRYRLLTDVIENRDTLYRIDTVLSNFQNQDDFLLRQQWPYQDLGNLGSAQQLIFRTVQKPIGVQFGYNTYDQFGLDPEKTRFYNTFSPHTWAAYVQGPQERSMFDMGLSRNIGPRTNLTFEYRRIGSVKNFGGVRTEDPATSHHSWRASGSYVTKDARYQTYFGFTHVWHRVAETGGVLPTSRDSTNETDPNNRKLDPDSMLLLEIQRPQLLDGTYTTDIRDHLRWFHQYALGEKRNVQIWYQLDRDFRRNSFETGSLSIIPYFRDTTIWANQFGLDSAGNRVLLPRYNYGTENSYDEFNYTNTTHHLGIKGSYKGIHTGGYIKYREWGYDGNRMAYDGLMREFYIGGHALWQPTRTSTIRAMAATIPGRDYTIEGHFLSSNFRVDAEIKRYAPTLFQTQYYGNHFSWNNDFNFTNAQRLTAEYRLPISRFKIMVGADYQNWDRLIVNGSDGRPTQIAGTTSLTSGYAELNYRFWRIRTEQQIRYTINTGADVLRVPTLYIHWKSYFEYKPARQEHIEVNVGLDMRYRSSYKADYYMAVTQQFYLQPNPGAEVPAAQQHLFPMLSAIVVDPYFTMRIHKALVFIKFNNVLQGIGGNGYFVTPFYPGLPRSFQFGLKWYFFD